MLSFILKLFKRIFNKPEVTTPLVINWDFENDKYDQEIQNKKRNIELFERIVGDNPMKQIDWTIVNGLEKFHYWQKLCETGAIYSPATVERYKDSDSTLRLKRSELRNDDTYDEYEARGGIGNKVIFTYKLDVEAAL